MSLGAIPGMGDCGCRGNLAPALVSGVPGGVPGLSGLGADTTQIQSAAAGQVAASGAQGGPIGGIIGAAGGALGLIGAEIPGIAAAFGGNKQQNVENALQQEMLRFQERASAGSLAAQAQASRDWGQTLRDAAPYAAVGTLGLGLIWGAVKIFSRPAAPVAAGAA